MIKNRSCPGRWCAIWTVMLNFALPLSVNPSFAQDVVGPIVGTVESTTANILYRPGITETKLRLSLRAQGELQQRVMATATAENDYVAKFSIKGLEPTTVYTYDIADASGRVLVPADQKYAFRTANPARQGGRVTVSFASCVDSEPNKIWNEMAALGTETVFLMGDTPYIDSSDLGVVRDRHRKFLQVPGLAALGAHTPVVGTWDDHDFGRNNGNGRNMMSGKGLTRQAFMEYRAHSQFGNGREGVYHKVDLGMIEVFLLDPRYFSQTGPSPVDPSQPTGFGNDQWQWLLQSLRESQAPFKVLACGAIWQDKKNQETDDLFTYWYERDALLDYIKSENIGGVVLLGGDIHVARHLRHPKRVGYDLHDFIISPGHTRVITSLDVYHPSLEWSLVEGWQFLTLTADGTAGEPRLIAEFRQPDSKVNQKVEISLADMTPAVEDHHQDLRARWTFDDDFKNSSSLGDRNDAVPVNDPSIVAEGISGGAVRFHATKEQFLTVPRSFLDDNSAAHSVSLWFKAESLPEHGSTQRAFLLESTAEGRPSNVSAWNLSLGLRTAPNANDINLQLFTHTLQPALKPEMAPTAISQGPFDTWVARERLLEEWNHVVFTFDSKSLHLYLNGKQVAKHTLPVPGPASGFGGLVLGGHRAGTGRNFNGFIDEVTVWQRALGETEVNAMFTEFQHQE